MAKIFQPEQLELSNGIPVILQHYDSPVAATYWWVKTGSADEEKSEAGFAHFLEHMLFKDAAAKETGKASTGQMARVIESLGGDINAYTSFDQTVYHVTCAAQHWERVLDAFGTMAKPQRFLVKDFEREREVILEELAKNEDSPGRQLFQSLFTTTFAKHPYGRPVIGFAPILKAATTPKLEQFYRRNYVASNMGLILVGPIQDETGARKKTILKYLEKHYGSKVLKKSKPAAVKPSKTRPRDTEIREKSEWVVKPFDVKTPTISFSFRVPDLAHEDIPALDLLSSILGMGELSRLHQSLFYKAALVTDVSGSLYVPKDPGMLYFQAEVDSLDKLKPVAEAMFKELKKIASEGPTTEELARVMANSESERLYATQTADGLASRIGFLKFIMGDLSFDQEYLDDLRAVDAAKIKEVANRYFDYRRMSGVILVPKESAHFATAEIEQLAHQALHFVGPEESQPESRLTQLNLPKSKSDPVPVEFYRLSSGMQVAFTPRPSSHVFSVHASAMGGVRLETSQPIDRLETDWGSSYMMSLTWNKGTSHHDARKIAAITEGRAAGIDGFSGRNSIGLQMTGLSRDWGVLSQLFTEILLDPTFPKDEMEHARRIAEDSIRSVDDHSGQLCSKLFLETLFQQHPYGRMIQGSVESIKEIKSDKLRAFHKQWIRPEKLVISISGPIKPKLLESWIQNLDREARSRSANHPSTSPASSSLLTIEDEPVLSAPRWVEKPLGREQTHILVGSLGTKVNAEDRHALRLLQTLLGGQSGRLFIELREKKSLAYTVAPTSFEGLEKGYVGTYIACSPQKREEAIQGIQTVLEKLAAKGPSPQEMNRAKEFFLGRRAMDLQSDTALATHYGLELLYQIPHASEDQIIKKIKSINAKDIQKVCKKYLIDPHRVTSIVG